MSKNSALWLTSAVLLLSGAAGSAQGKVRQFDATVQSIDGNSIVIQERSGVKKTYKVDAQTPVAFTQGQKSLSDLQAGARVRVWVTEQGQVTKLKVTGLKGTAKAPAAASSGPGDSQLIEGVVATVDRERNTFTLKLRTGSTVRFAAEKSTKINEHGAKGGLVDADFSALAPGETVRLEVLYGKVDTLSINRIRD